MDASSSAITSTTLPALDRSLDSLSAAKDEKGHPVSESSSPLQFEKDTAASPQHGPIDDQPYFIGGFKLYVVFACLVMVFFLVMLDIAIIVTAVPRITSDFHSLLDVGWYGSAYQLASAALQPLTGKLYTYFRSKWTFLTFFAIFELGSLLCGVASSSKMLIVGRAVAGMGASGIQNGTLTIIAAMVPMEKRPMFIGMLMGISQLGLVLGPLLGGALTEYTTWRWCFYINLPIGGLVAALLLFVHIPEQTTKPTGTTLIRTILTKLDLVGFALFAPAAVQLMLALQYGGNQYSWESATVIGLFCGAAATFILFLLWEHHEGDAAMIPLSMVAKRTVWSSCVVMGFVMSMTSCASYYLPIYFQAVKGASPTLSGVYMLPGILSQLAIVILSGITVGKLGYYLPWSLFSGVLSAIGNGLLTTFSPSTSTAVWIGFQILLGAGRGAGMQMPLIAVQNTLPPAQNSIAMSLVMFSMTIFGAAFLTFADTIFTNSLKTQIPHYAPAVDPKVVIAGGSAAIRDVFTGDDLAGVLLAYSKSVDRVFYLTAGAGVGAFCFAWGMGWKDIRKKTPVKQDEP